MAIMFDLVENNIAKRETQIAVVGLGYVGLPVACCFAAAGFEVTGVDIQVERVRQINEGVSPIKGCEPGLAELLATVVSSGRFQATTDYDQIRDVDIILINVETPVDADHKPKYKALQAAIRSVGQILKDGALVIVESTVAPGTIYGVVKPLLEASSGKKLNDGFFLGHCPERVMPGKLLANIAEMSRVCGGSSPEAAHVMASLYRTIVRADLDTTDYVTAELVKTAENAFRDVNIAFANELALICEANGADFMAVRELVNKSPGRNVLLAGAGVGGHCIPKDPWLLVNSSIDKLPIRLIPAAREVNEYMPYHMLHLIETGLARHGLEIDGARIAVLGYAYLENSDDTRNSPSITLVNQLRECGAIVVIQDPHVPEFVGPWEDAVREANAAVFMVAHEEYLQIKLNELAQCLVTPVIVDGRQLFAGQRAAFSGLTYLGIGNIGKSPGIDSSLWLLNK